MHLFLTALGVTAGKAESKPQRRIGEKERKKNGVMSIKTSDGDQSRHHVVHFDWNRNGREKAT